VCVKSACADSLYCFGDAIDRVDDSIIRSIEKLPTMKRIRAFVQPVHD
jgi:hypothetical protein